MYDFFFVEVVVLLLFPRGLRASAARTAAVNPERETCGPAADTYSSTAAVRTYYMYAIVVAPLRVIVIAYLVGREQRRLWNVHARTASSTYIS